MLLLFLVWTCLIAIRVGDTPIAGQALVGLGEHTVSRLLWGLWS